jgi:hypothetical protein
VNSGPMIFSATPGPSAPAHFLWFISREAPLWHILGPTQKPFRRFLVHVSAVTQY